MVIKNKIMSEVCDFLLNDVSRSCPTKNDAVFQFELGLSSHLIRKGYRYKALADEFEDGIFMKPHHYLRSGKFPFMKIGSFREYDENRYNILNALSYIKHEYKYDISFITELIQDRYEIDLTNFETELETCGKWETITRSSTVLFEDIMDFVQRNRDFYLYGAGARASHLFWYHCVRRTNFKGFIVTEKKEEGQRYFDYPVFSLAEVADEKPAVLVALGYENTSEVRKIIKDLGFSEVLYLYN